MRLRDAPGLGVPLKVLSVGLDMGAERPALVDALARTLRSKAAGRTSP